MYVTMEIYMWAIMALTALYSESKMIAANNDAGAFRNFTLNSSYYVTAFGNPSDGIGRAIIRKLTSNVFLRSLGKFAMGKIPLEQSENRFSFLSLSAVTQIAINGVMSVGFVFYCIFAVILLIGISEVCAVIV